jgi:1-deoxy-D-xylulose-5-phosphate synthase
MRCVPNLVIMAPADENECRQMLYTATTLDQPAAVRYPRGYGPGVAVDTALQALPVGRAQVRREGHSGLALLGFGTMVAPAERIAERLDATLVNMRFVKPLDEELILNIAARHSAIVTLEENAIAGGAGGAVSELLAQHGIQLPLLHLGLPDRFVEHGSREDCLRIAGLDAASLEVAIERFWSQPGLARATPASA